MFESDVEMEVLRTLCSNKRPYTGWVVQQPERKRHTLSWLGAEEARGSAQSKIIKEWTFEEDGFILNMVEQHGKRWSMIASCLPGRSDNSVRNRYNRMEQAQSLREMRGVRPGGYRCRRCGQPKRGHTCRLAAPANGNEPPLNLDSADAPATEPCSAAAGADSNGQTDIVAAVASLLDMSSGAARAERRLSGAVGLIIR